MKKLTDTFVATQLAQALEADKPDTRIAAIADTVTILTKNPAIGSEYLMAALVDALADEAETCDTKDQDRIEKLQNAESGIRDYIAHHTHKATEGFVQHVVTRILNDGKHFPVLHSILETAMSVRPDTAVIAVEEAKNCFLGLDDVDTRRHAMNMIGDAVTINPAQTVDSPLVGVLTQAAIADDDARVRVKASAVLDKTLHYEPVLARNAEEEAEALAADEKFAKAANLVLCDIIHPVREMDIPDVAAARLHHLALGL